MRWVNFPGNNSFSCIICVKLCQKSTSSYCMLIVYTLISFTTKKGPLNWKYTRLTYNCAHLRLTKESLTIWVKFFGVKIFLGEGGKGRGEGQNCTGQKCTEHELVLLMFFVLKCLDDLLWGFKMPLVGLLWLLVHHQINSVKNKMLMEVVKSAQSTSSCFYFNSYLGWPKSLLEL